METRRWWLLLGLLGWLTGVLAHDWVQRGFAALVQVWGFDRVQALQLLGWGTLGFVGLLSAGRGVCRRRGPAALGPLIGVCVLVGLAWSLLMQTRAEAVHLLQYAGLALVWQRVIGDPTRTLAWCLLLGGLDEAWQRLVLYADRPDVRMDFNDIVLNGLGALVGLTWAWSRRRP